MQTSDLQSGGCCRLTLVLLDNSAVFTNGESVVGWEGAMGEGDS
jgi:hypothetical protein